MAKVIRIATKRPRMIMEDEPCAGCNDRPTCHYTCKRARIWWANFATQFGGRVVKSG